MRIKARRVGRHARDGAVHQKQHHQLLSAGAARRRLSWQDACRPPLPACGGCRAHGGRRAWANAVAAACRPLRPAGLSAAAAAATRPHPPGTLAQHSSSAAGRGSCAPAMAMEADLAAGYTPSHWRANGCTPRAGAPACESQGPQRAGTEPAAAADGVLPSSGPGDDGGLLDGAPQALPQPRAAPDQRLISAHEAARLLAQSHANWVPRVRDGRKWLSYAFRLSLSVSQCDRRTR